MKDIKNVHSSETFRFADGFSDRVMQRIADEKEASGTLLVYRQSFRQLAWFGAAASILLLIALWGGEDFSGFHLFEPELSFYEEWDSYLFYQE